MNRNIFIALLMVFVSGCSGGLFGVSNQPANDFMGLPLVYSQEFDRPVPEQWEPSDPAAWKFGKDGERSVYALIAKCNYKPAVRSPENFSILKDVCISDFVLDVWLRSTVRNYAHRDMCVFFGHQAPVHYYYVHFGLKSDSVSNNILMVNGKPRVAITKTRTDGTPWTGDYHHIRIVREVDSGKIEAYFDDMGTPAMTAEDTTFKWGRIGAGSFDDLGNIDRVILWGHKFEPAKKKAASQPY
ncbi:MAG: hypothetical protein ACYTF1_16345 [Planctomycetota bacterium]|jgi:hypothetical protein